MSSNYVETQVISSVASHSGVQEECHSKVQDPLQQRPGSGREEYWTKVQEDHCDLQCAADMRSYFQILRLANAMLSNHLCAIL